MPEPLSVIRAVVFDLDGLMFDTEAVFFRSASEMLAARGKVFTLDIMRAMIGRQPAISSLAFKTMSGLEGEPADLMAEAKARFDARLDTDVSTMPGLTLLLDRLDAMKLPHAVATSSKRAYAERLLGGHGLIGRFAFILAAEDVVRHKPDPEIYRTAAARLSFEPSSLMVLEDTPTGLTAARAAGAFAVGVPHDYSPASDLGMADLIVPRLDDAKVLERLEVGRDR